MDIKNIVKNEYGGNIMSNSEKKINRLDLDMIN